MFNGMNGQPNSGAQPPQQNMTPSQLIQQLMRMDPQQRNQVIMRNPQLQQFIQQYEAQRRAAMQQAQDQAQTLAQKQAALQQQQQQQQSHGVANAASTAQALYQQQLQRQQQQQVAQAQAHAQAQMAQAAARRPSNRKKPTPKPTPTVPHQPLMQTPGSQVVPNMIPSPQQHLIPGAAVSGIPNAAAVVSAQQEKNKVPPADKLEDIHRWSKLISRDGKSVPTSTLLYEQVVDRDSNYDELMKKEMTKPFEAPLIQRMMNDLKYYQAVRDSRLKGIGLPAEINGFTDVMWGEGYSGYGNGFTKGKTQLVLPQHRKRNSRIPEKYVSKEELVRQAQKAEELVPIRLEFDIDRDGFKLNDTFLWNLNESTVSLEQFVALLMEDYKFSSSNTVNSDKILSSIKEQINDYHPMIYPKTSKTKMPDLRFTVNLDITIGNNQLIDKFDWDLTNAENNPEEFARVLCDEMSLPGEFLTAISHAIREQCQIFIKSLYLIGYRFDGSLVTGDELKEFIRPQLDTHSLIRPRYLLSEYTPSLQEISYETIEKLMKERERESRRKKRGQTRVGRRGGVILPDLHDFPKTFRSPIPNKVLPGGVNLLGDHEEYLEFPISVDIPTRQLKEWEDHKKKQEEIRQKKLIEAAAAEQAAAAAALAEANMANQRRVSFSYDYGNSFTVKIKLRGSINPMRSIRYV